MKNREGANPEQGWYRTPNYFVDRLLRKLTSSQQNILHVVLRETEGWRSDADPKASRDWAEISLDQFEEKTGLARATLVEAIRLSIDQGILERRTLQVRRTRSFCYRVVKRADLKEAPAHPDRRQSQLPFNVTEFKNHTPSNADEVQNLNSVTEFKNHTPSPPVLIVDQRKDDDRSDLTEFKNHTPSNLEPFPHLDPPPLVFYSDVTGNRIGPNDLRYYKTVSQHPDWLIKCGVALGFLRHELAESTTAPIRSFKFFLNPIAEVKERGVDATYLEYALRVITRVRPREANVMAIAVNQALTDNRSELLRTAQYADPPKYERPAATQTTEQSSTEPVAAFTIHGEVAVWARPDIVERIRERIPKQTFDTWFAPLEFRDGPNRCTAFAPNAVITVWIRDHYREIIEQAAEAHGCTVEFEVGKNGQNE